MATQLLGPRRELSTSFTPESRNEFDLIGKGEQISAPGGGGGGFIGPTDPRSLDTNQAPAQSSSGADAFSSALSNIINTGSSAPAPDSGVPRATLVNPETGERRAVDVGSEEAQQLFGQNFVLETQAPGADASAAGGGTLTGEIETFTQSPTEPNRLAFFRGEADRIRAEAFSAVYGFTPDEWQNQPPSVQRGLRNQRVQALAGQLGNMNTAIKTVKEEMAATKETTLERLNLAMQFGVTDQLDDATMAAIVAETGLSAEIIKGFSQDEDLFELKTIGGNLYSIRLDPRTGEVETKLAIAKPVSSSGGGRVSSSGSGRVSSGLTLDDLTAAEKALGEDVDDGLVLVSSLDAKEKNSFNRYVQAKVNSSTSEFDSTGGGGEFIGPIDPRSLEGF